MKKYTPLLIDAVATAGGLSQEQALEQIDRVFAAIPDVLKAGKAISIPSVGSLHARRKNAYVPGSRDRKARAETRAYLRGGIIEQGEPYDCDPPEKPKVTMAAMRYLA